MKRSLDRLHRPFFCLFVKKAKKWSSNNPIISATLFEAVKSHKLLVMNTVLFAVANSRPNGGFRDFYSPSVKIPPQIERTRAVLPLQTPFNGEFSTPESEFITENGGNSGKKRTRTFGFCRILPFWRRRASIPIRPFAAKITPKPARHFPFEGKIRKLGTI